MTVSIDDFIPTATEEQKQVLFNLALLAERENEICKKYNEKIKPYSEMAKKENPWKDGQYAKIIQEDAGDFALLATKEERDELKRIREKMKTLYMKAVEIGMKDLGIIQRYYENYVGESINNQ